MRQGARLSSSERAPGIRRGRATVRALCLLPILLAIVGTTPALAGDPTLRRLDGLWEGPGMMLQIDSARLQARTDPDHPFSWRPLIIQNVSGNMIVFRIGEQSFIGLFAQEQLTVTSPQLAGSFSLTRRDP